MMKSSILIVEDNRALAQALAVKAERWGFQTTVTPTLALARKSLASRRPDVVLLDLGLPDGSGMELLDADLPLTAIITAHGEIDHALVAKKAGVEEFFVKPVDFAALDAFLQGALNGKSDNAPESAFSSGFIGASPAMRPVFQQIAQACASSRPVLISGAEGTGRSHVAHLIQRHWEMDGDLLFVDCRRPYEILDTLGDDVLLVLDHVDALPLDHQIHLAKRLAVEGACRRVIAICGEAGLLSEVQAHRFHPDLYYQLQGVGVRLPRLAERIEDLSALCSLFLGELENERILRLSDEALELLSAQEWQGNLRELRQMLRFAISATDRAELNPGDFPESLKPRRKQRVTDSDVLATEIAQWVGQQVNENGELPEYRELLAGVESRLLRNLLARFDDKPSVMAQHLGINRSTLRKRLREVGLG